MNFGILGCGMIANIHAEAIRNIEDAKVTGVSDPCVDNAERFANAHDVMVYKDYESMLQDSNIDIVCICTPSGFHAEAAIQALEHGKHVVLEKPMALTVESADAVIAASEKNGALLTVISQLRFSEDIQKVKKLVEDGAFGKLMFCDLYMKYWREPSYYASSNWKGTFKFDGGGALMNQGIHGIDVLQFIVGELTVVKGKVKTLLHDIEVEDTAVAVLEFKNGALGVIEGSTSAYPGFERRIEIIGEKGYVVLIENKIEKLMLDGKMVIDNDGVEVSNSAADATAVQSYMHTLQISNLIRAIEGKEKLLIDAKEGKKAVKIIRDIYESSERDKN